VEATDVKFCFNNNKSYWDKSYIPC